MNPYAAPRAKLEEAADASSVWREGKLVRIDRTGGLPARCVVCNGQAEARVKRTLYWSPVAWRAGAVAAPFVLLFLGILLEWFVLAALFWPSIIVLLVANMFVRKQLKVELAICPRHRRVRLVLQWLSVGAIAAVGLVFYTWREHASADALFAALGVVIVLAIVYGSTGAQAVSLKRLTPEHAWLGGTGEPFRKALPELPG